MVEPTPTDATTPNSIASISSIYCSGDQLGCPKQEGRRSPTQAAQSSMSTIIIRVYLDEPNIRRFHAHQMQLSHFNLGMRTLKLKIKNFGPWDISIVPLDPLQSVSQLGPWKLDQVYQLISKLLDINIPHSSPHKPSSCAAPRCASPHKQERKSKMQTTRFCYFFKEVVKDIYRFQ